MEKNVIAFLLSVVLAAGNIGTVPALAAETAVQEETSAESTEEVVKDAALASEEDTEAEADQSTEEASKAETGQSVEEEEDTVELGETGEGSDTSETEENETQEVIKDEQADATGQDGENSEEEGVNPDEDVDQHDSQEEGDDILREDLPETDNNAADTGVETAGTEDQEATESADSATAVISGECGTEGDNLTWELSGPETELTLTISGSGQMASYTEETKAPWFTSAASIKYIVLSEEMTSIGDYAFAECRNIEEISISKSVTSIGENAFLNCDALKTINYAGTKEDWDQINHSTIPEGVEVVCGKDETTEDSIKSGICGENLTWTLSGPETELKLTISGSGLMASYTGEIKAPWFASAVSIKYIVLSEEMTSIGDYAFSECSGFEKISISENVKSIGENAFLNCDALKTINYAGTSEEWDQINHSVLPEGVEVVCAKGSTKKDIIQTGTCGSNLTWMLSGPETEMTLTISGTGGMTNYGDIYDTPWKRKGAIRYIVVEEGVTSIGTHAFSYCSSLINISIPEGVTSIGQRAFQRCSSLTSITIPNGTKSIGKNAFLYCNSLASITIPESLTNIGLNAFSYCNALKEIHINSIKTWLNLKNDGGNYVLSSDRLLLNNEPLTDIVIPDGITSIRASAFSDCESLKSITIPKGVKSIGAYAFSNCSSLTSITIPEGLMSIGDSAFSSCGNLKEIHINSIKTWLSLELASGNGALSSNCLFLNNEPLTDIVIPDGITSIRASAFENCSSLTSITIPEGVTSIGQNAFENCSSLTSITIPEGVASIEDNAFENCSSLTSITIPESVTSIGGHAFYSCRKLTSITISEHVTSIGSSAFENCSSLTSITIPESVTSIGGFAFENCSSLTSITIPESVTSIGGHAFSYCSSLTSITIPETVTSIGEYTFNKCSSLTSITIPAGVTSIGKSAFKGCSNLQEIHINNIETWLNLEVGSDNSELSSNLLYINNEPLTNLVIPDGIASIRDNAFSNCKNLKSVTIPESVTSIGDFAFYNCFFLASVTVPETVTSIGNSAFYHCSFSSIRIPEGVTSIGDSAFYYCYKLTSITIPENVTSIGSSAFSYCSSLTSITIPEGVTSIGSSAFSYCGSLTSITIPETVTSIGSSAFSNCRSLTSITIPETVTSIGSSAFSNCKSLTSIAIPETVTSIGSSAFSNCSSLISITIPETVTSIGNSAFSNCSMLTNITIPEGVTSIGSSAFSNCSNLTSITIPETVTSIGDSTFNKCSSLISITIPESVTSIGKNAFIDCSNLNEIHINNIETWLNLKVYSGNSNLTSERIYLNNEPLTNIVIPDGITSIRGDAFSGCSSLTSITIPESVTSVGTNAFTNCSNLKEIHINNIKTWLNLKIASGNSELSSNLLYINNESITTVVIPDSITSIRTGAFSGCKKLKSVTISEGVTSIESDAFSDCGNLTSITIPNGLTSIASGAFRNCNFLRNYYISDIETWLNLEVAPGNFIQSNKKIYLNNELLTNVIIPDGITSIRIGAFSGCSYLTNIMIPEGVISVGGSAFRDCSSLTSINIPEGVISIGSYAFYTCKKLDYISIPYSMQTIDTDAFYGYPGRIRYWGTSDEWNTIYKGSKEVELISVSLDRNSLTLDIDQATQLILTSNYDDIDVGNTIWSSLDDEIASVDETGTVTAKNAGETVVTATTERGNHSASCVVKVIVLTKGVHLDQNSLVLYHGETDNLIATIEPQNADNMAVTWESSNPETVSVDENGHIEALKVGTAIVTVTTEEGNYTASCEVAVEHEWEQGYKIDKEPTCTENGSKSIHCKRCEEKKDVEEIPAFGHSFTHYVPNLKAGTKSAECDNGCGTVDTVEIPQENSGTCGNNLTWKLYENSVLFIGGSGSMEEYDSNKPAPWSALSFKSCVIDNGVSSIGGSAFENCRVLESVELPDSVTSIGGYAFYNCSSLMTLKMSDRISSIGNNAFDKCAGLEELSFNSNPPTFGNNAFKGCGSLTIAGFEGTAAETVAEEYGLTFRSLGSKGSCGASADYLFTKEDGSLVISGSGQIQDYIVDTKTGKASTPWSDEDVRSIRIASDITRIGDGAFAGCKSVTQITLPYRVSAIGEYMCAGCTSLETVTFDGFIRMIPTGAFKGCSSLNSIDLKDTVKKIQAMAFEDCSSLTDVSIPYDVTEIGDYAFSGTGITSITLPRELVYIGECAFKGTNIRTIEIPAGTTSILPTAFTDCETLENIVVNNSNKNYASSEGILTTKDGSVIIKCPAAKAGSYTTSHSVTEIKSDAFKGCRCLTDINLSEGLETIGDSAFSGVTISRIQIPSSVRSIGDNAFFNCSSLEAIDVDEGNEYFASIEGVLYNKDLSKLIACPAVKDGELELSEDVTEISDNAFANNSELDVLTIPYYVNSIGDNAFAGSSIIIKGYDNSYAKEYAVRNGLQFESMGDYCIKEAVIGDTINAYELIGNDLSDDIITSWKSSNPEIASVNEEGVVTAISEGKVRISFSADEYTGSCLINIYKHWGYDIIFAANGGSGSMESMNNLDPSETYELSQNMFTRYGYVFDSWTYQDAEGNTITFDDCNQINGLAGDGESITLRAKWKETNTTISISAGESSVTGIENYQYILYPSSGYRIYGYSLTGGGIDRSATYPEVESAPESLILGRLAAGTYRLTWIIRSYTVTQGDMRLVRDSQGNYTYHYVYEYNWGNNTTTYRTTIWAERSGSISVPSVSITDASVNEISSVYPQNGEAITPVSAVRYNGVKLLEGRDYTLEYKNNTEVGHASVAIKGKGKYTGTITKYFWIVDNEGDKVSLFNDNTEVRGLDNCVYNGKALTLTGIVVTIDGVTLENNKDYTVSYDNNVNAGKGKALIEGIGIYKDTIEAEFEILPKSFITADISGISNKTYTGKAQTQAVVVKDDTVTLKNGTDYTVSYKNNINAGTASVTIKGTGNYTGSVTKTFTIKKTANAVTAKNFVKTYSAAAQTFALGAKAKGGTLTYASNSKSVTVSKAGKVTVKAKFIGKATITIAAQNANYNKVTKKITVTVVPTKTGIASVTSPAAGQMVVKWKKNAVGTGYQIQYSTSSKFTGAKSALVTKNTVLSKKITNLTKGKKYFVRMRTYKTVGGVKYYSGWCTVKTVTIRK